MPSILPTYGETEIEQRSGAALHVGRWPLHPLDFGPPLLVGHGPFQDPVSLVVQEYVVLFLLSSSAQSIISLHSVAAFTGALASYAIVCQ